MSQLPTPEQIEEGLRSDRDLWKAIALRQEQTIHALRERNAELESVDKVRIVAHDTLQARLDCALSELAEARARMEALMLNHWGIYLERDETGRKWIFVVCDTNGDDVGSAETPSEAIDAARAAIP